MSASAQFGGNPWAHAARPVPTAAAPSLVDLLGATWAMGVKVSGVAWAGDVAGFALADGSVAMARAEWEGAARARRRDPLGRDTGIDVTPASAPPPPVARQRAHDGACLAIAAGPKGFVSGGEDGAVYHLAVGGTSALLARRPGSRIDVLAVGPDGRVAYAAGKQVHVGSDVVDLPASATALAFGASGTRLAIAHYQGVTLWTVDAASRLLPTSGFPRSVAWGPDATHVACGLQENIVIAWRLSDGEARRIGETAGQPRSIAVSADGWLAASGSAQALCWKLGESTTAIACGRSARRMPVSRVAWHPIHQLLAVGYRNGAVLLCQPGSEEVLFARASSLVSVDDTEGDPVSALAWSEDGERLAIGTQSGAIAVVALPGSLFRFPTPTAGSA